VTDYSESGAVPIEDAAVDDPPTVEEVLDEQESRDDLPDPSHDPDHQQVTDESGPSRLRTVDVHANRIASPDDGPR